MYLACPIMENVTLQKIDAHDFRYVPRKCRKLTNCPYGILFCQMFQTFLKARSTIISLVQIPFFFRIVKDRIREEGNFHYHKGQTNFQESLRINTQPTPIIQHFLLHLEMRD